MQTKEINVVEFRDQRHAIDDAIVVFADRAGGAEGLFGQLKRLAGGK
jgi:hypothetical protein